MHSDSGAIAGTIKPKSAQYLGTMAAFATYSLWGLFPLYWKRLAAIDAFQILGHRIIWAALFTVAILAVQGRLGALASLMRDRKRFLAAAAAGFLVSINWGTYIWAVSNGHVNESALGYYINPLFSVALGAIFLRERLDRWTVLAVAVAAIGVLVASAMLGSPPWIALVLASTFGIYGLVKKKAGLDPVTGLAAETIAVAPFALIFVASRHLAGQGALGGSDLVASVMLVLAGAVTAIPLLAFAYAANRITLQRLGFIQYISPSCQLALGILVYREELPISLIVAFSTVIVAVLIYAVTRFTGRSAREA